MANGPDARGVEIDGLRKVADEAARTVRNAYITFLSIGTYIAVVIAGTTDKQLLLVAPVTMPILNVDIPVTGFYTAVPWLFVILHLNLLVQLFLLSRKLHQLREALETIYDTTAKNDITAKRNARAVDAELTKLFPFPFSQMLVNSHPQWSMRLVLGFIVVVSTIVLPLLLLLWAQFRFLPYHDALLTGFQRSAVVLDVILITYFWPRMLARDGRWHWWWRPNSWGGSAGKNWSLFATVFSAVVMFLTLFVAEVPDGLMERLVRKMQRPVYEEGCSSDGCSDITYQFFTWIEANDWPFDRNLDLANADLVKVTLPTDIIRQLRGGTVAERRDALKKVAGLNLDGRDLRFADFENALMPNASLRGASVEGATLFRAIWPGADLRALHVPQGTRCLPGTDAWLPNRGIWATDGNDRSRVGTDPSRTRTLHYSNLGLAKKYTDGLACLTRLGSAKNGRFRGWKEGANLVRINLMDARLPAQALAGADLSGAWLVGADLRWARLTDADLRGSTLHGANMSSARLRVANLFGAELYGANLSRADLDFANLKDTDMRGADLRWASLRGADLWEAALHGADLYEAKLHGADLSGVELHGANLSRAELYGALFDDAILDLADLSGVRRGRLTWEMVRELETSSIPRGLDSRAIDEIVAPIEGRTDKSDTLVLARRDRARYCEPMRSNPHTDCLYDYPLERYGPEVVAEVLAPLACAADAKTGVAENIAQRAGSSVRPSDISPWLVPALLDEQCIGARTLSDGMRASLEGLKRKLQAQGRWVE